MPGPKPTPTTLRILRGNPGHRPLPADEPKPEALEATHEALKAPRWLDRIARETWQDLAPELQRLGLLTKLDHRQALAGACAWWSVYRRANAKLKGVLTQRSRANGTTARAELDIARKAYDAAMKTFAGFGILPAERTRLAAPTPKAIAPTETPHEDPYDAFRRRRAERRQRPAG